MRILQPSFTGGELAPSLRKRVDLAKYSTGLALCRNFYIHPHGGVSNREGFEFITEVKDSSQATILIPFQYSDSDTYMLEFGHEYMRVIRNGGQVVLSATPSAWATSTAYTAGDHVANGGSNYYCHTGHTSGATDEPGVGANWADYWHLLTSDIVEIPTPYQASELVDLDYAQSADVITIAHRNHAPRELSRVNHDEWTLTSISFGAEVTTPTGLSATPSGPFDDNDRTFNYKVTAVDSDGRESVASTSASALVDTLWEVGEKVTLAWTAVAGADRYNVYCSRSGLYGYIGTAETNAFTDDNILPDTADTPPETQDPFSGSGNFPGAVFYHEQRLGFASTMNDPQKLWVSQIGEPHNFNTSTPLKDDQSFSIRLFSGQVNKVRSVMGLEDLIVHTAGAAWKLAVGDNPFSFYNVRTKLQGNRGSGTVKPILIDDSILYLQPHNNVVRDFAYNLTKQGYTGNDLSIMSNHLFDQKQVVSWSYAQDPDSIVWCVMDDGTMLGLTYMREHEVWGWHQHDTQGEFEWVASVSESAEDAVYVIVKRTVDGEDKRYIERKHDRVIASVNDAFFLDSGLTYDGILTRHVTGLDHLEGMEVNILVDGNVVRGQTVEDGMVDMTIEATNAHIGLAYTSDMQTLEPPIGRANGMTKSVSSVIVSVLDSRGIWVGQNEDDLIEYKQRRDEAWDHPIDLYSGDFEVTLMGGWEDKGSVFIRQSDPLPATITAVIPDIEIGG